MPLFGSKKKDDEKKGYPTQQPAYPTQQSAYPQQQAGYPQQQAGYPQQQAGYPQAPPMQGQPQGPPPAYSQYPQAGGPPPPQMYAPPPQQGYAGAPAPSYPQMQQRPVMVTAGSFDSGARFDGISQPTIPPPPPGCAPNAAQFATMNGQSVVMQQNQGSFWTGGSDGGYCWF